MMPRHNLQDLYQWIRRTPEGVTTREIADRAGGNTHGVQGVLIGMERDGLLLWEDKRDKWIFYGAVEAG